MAGKARTLEVLASQVPRSKFLKSPTTFLPPYTLSPKSSSPKSQDLAELQKNLTDPTFLSREAEAQLLAVRIYRVSG